MQSDENRNLDLWADETLACHGGPPAEAAADEALDQGGPMVLPCPVVTCPVSCRRIDEA